MSAHRFTMSSIQQLTTSSFAVSNNRLKLRMHQFSIVRSHFTQTSFHKIQCFWIHPSRTWKLINWNPQQLEHLKIQQLNSKMRWFDRTWIYHSSLHKAPDFLYFNSKKYSFVSNSGFEHIAKRVSSIMNLKTPTNDAQVNKLWVSLSTNIVCLEMHSANQRTPWKKKSLLAESSHDDVQKQKAVRKTTVSELHLLKCLNSRSINHLPALQMKVTSSQQITRAKKNQNSMCEPMCEPLNECLNLRIQKSSKPPMRNSRTRESSHSRIARIAESRIPEPSNSLHPRSPHFLNSRISNRWIRKFSNP